MQSVRSGADLRAWVRNVRCAGQSVGFVPTMGYLHQGHLALVRRARAENDQVVLSIFVNPTQFGPREDFARYPRDLEHDRQLAEEAGVDVLFLPETEEMYPLGAERQRVWVDPGRLADHLCGATRPGHFRGVTTVVTKLFNLVQPDRAYFGQKDAQQALIVTAMAADLAQPVQIVLVPTVREPDGLAMSSRNVYLSPEERAQAPALHAALLAAQRLIAGGERAADRIESELRAVLANEAPLGRLDYATVADLATLQPVQGDIQGETLVALAVYFGTTRLIDNMMLHWDGSRPRFS